MRHPSERHACKGVQYLLQEVRECYFMENAGLFSAWRTSTVWHGGLLNDVPSTGQASPSPIKMNGSRKR